MKDDESVAASRAMFERIAAEQRGKGMVVARVGIPVVTDSGDLQIKTLETIKHYLISRLKVTVSSELEITGEDSENDLSSRIAPITFEVARVTVENTGFYAPLKKRLDTFGQGSPTFALTKRVIGRIPGEVDDWLRHLAEDSRDSLETFCLAERALELAEARFGPDDPVTAKYLRLLAFCCVRQFRYEEAEELLRRQLAIYVKEYGRISLDTAGVLANLAGALNHQRRSKQALPLMREALRIGKKIQGPDSVETGKFCFNLGTIYEDLNRDELALQYYRKARSILEEALGAEHPALERVYRRLAWRYKGSDNYAGVTEIYRNQINMCVARFGATHQDTLDQVEWLARSYLDWGRPDEAIKLYREWIDRIDKSDENSLLARAWLMELLARVLEKTGNYQAMEACCTRALDQLPGDSGQVCTQRSTLLALKAEALGEMGIINEADSSFKLAFKQAKGESGRSRIHRRWVQCLLDWADSASWEELDDTAETCYWHALVAIGEMDDRVPKISMQRCLFGLGRIMQSQGRYQDARDFYRDALEALEDEFGVNDYRTVLPLEKLAWLFRRAGQPEKAYEYELRIQKTRKSKPARARWHYGEGCPSIRQVLRKRRRGEASRQLEQE